MVAHLDLGLVGQCDRDGLFPFTSIAVKPARSQECALRCLAGAGVQPLAAEAFPLWGKGAWKPPNPTVGHWAVLGGTSQGSDPTADPGALVWEGFER